MKKILTTCLAAFLVVIVAHAQISPGIKAGLNIANFSGDDVDTNSKVGFHVGGLAHIHLSDQFALQPELLFSLQGAKSDQAGDDTKLNVSYLNIPVLFQYMFENGLRLEAGPQLGFLLSAKTKTDGTSVDVKDGFNSIDISLPIGIGYISASGFGVDARYSFGLSNINEDDNNKITNSVLQIGVFYQFGER